jgi:hypothetical protein
LTVNFQPLHVADNHDRGGNGVDALGATPNVLARQLLARITPEQAADWGAGTPEDWAWEAFAIAQENVYGDPPLSPDTVHRLDAAYVKRAKEVIEQQLSRAGIRLATILNKALGAE